MLHGASIYVFHVFISHGEEAASPVLFEVSFKLRFLKPTTVSAFFGNFFKTCFSMCINTWFPETSHVCTRQDRFSKLIRETSHICIPFDELLDPVSGPSIVSMHRSAISLRQLSGSFGGWGGQGAGHLFVA